MAPPPTGIQLTESGAAATLVVKPKPEVSGSVAGMLAAAAFAAFSFVSIVVVGGLAAAGAEQEPILMLGTAAAFVLVPLLVAMLGSAATTVVWEGKTLAVRLTLDPAGLNARGPMGGSLAADVSIGWDEVVSVEVVEESQTSLVVITSRDGTRIRLPNAGGYANAWLVDYLRHQVQAHAADDQPVRERISEEAAELTARAAGKSTDSASRS